MAHASPRWPLSFKGNGGRKKGKQRVLILMSDTGGGHRASAEAIKAGFEEAYGDKYQVGGGWCSGQWGEHAGRNGLPRLICGRVPGGPT